jgi:outer membrane protein TolC
LDKKLQITRHTAESRKNTLNLFQLRFDKGIISEVDLSQAQSEYEDALARLRYDEGYTSYLEVLDAERSLFNVELSHTTSQNTLFRSLIDIYKSMGGGWVAKAEEGVSALPVMEAGFLP